MLIVPIQPVPAQTLIVPVAGTSLQIDLRQMFYGLFATVWKDNALVVAGVRCQNLNPIVRSAYLGAPGDLMFIDNEGDDDPSWEGLGSRFSLALIEPQGIAK